MPHETELPNAPDAETAFIGSILLDSRLMDEAASEPPEIFYSYTTRLIFTAMLELHRQHAEINPVTIANALGKDAQKVGGVPGISKLSDKLPAVARLAPYTKILRQKLTARQGYKEAARLQQAFLDESEDPQSVLAVATERFSSMREASTNGFQGGALADIRRQVEDHLYVIKAGLNPSISTGLERLDQLTAGGIKRGEMWGVGALSSRGKTALLVQMLLHVASRRDLSQEQPGVVLFSLEMTALLIGLRILAGQAGIGIHKIKTGMSESDLNVLLEKCRESFDVPVWIYTDCRSVTDIHSRIKTLKRKHPIQVVGIDYYGKLHGHGRGRDRYENRVQELKYIADYLQQEIAIQEEVGLIVPAQFNRSAWNAGERGPGNIDGGEAYFQACDLFAVLDTDSKKAKPGDPSIPASLAIHKQRNGPTATGKEAIQLDFHRDQMKFHSRLSDVGDEVPDNKESQFL